MFKHKVADHKHTNTILRPISFNYSHSIIIERSKSYKIHFVSSHSKKTMVPEASFDKFDASSDAPVRGNFGVN